MTAATQLFLDDFAIGQSFEGVTRTVDQAMFEMFAQLTGDSHPIHYDEDYAKQTRFGAPVAHGLLLTALTALGATSLSRRLTDAMVALVEQDGRYLRPVMAGDVLTSRFTVAAIEAKDRIRFAVGLENARGEAVYNGHHVYRLKRR
jgi:3-hydroxybutyryl-CoA dehydratase